MLNPKSPEEVLWSVFPLLLVAIALVGGIFFLPRLQQANLDDRSRASEPVNTPTSPQGALTQPEIICSSLYDPVCGSNEITYPNSCEANLAKITQFTSGECEKPINLPTSN